MTEDWTRDEAEALQRLPHDERLKMRLGPPRKNGPMTGDQLKLIRAALGLTQREMGEILGVTPDHISRLERGLVPIKKLIANAANHAVWVANYESLVD